ncbi:hypothetical protein SARC_00522 [Sphaeroforma arctica JP610]|uniref:Uncharacterized protein n=1 Tax=Sphaeroforma arctica JP610 TaxID=667725 RepID=A0A0L0GET1_9EUKA|nr:hypothetical protein SARC_00522 [Sphaeroforma arctica JP610]KNC87381.1 hypothetical protein SARC_00522 [Sphaeroforma arctica JP610]|eukprot:XP_014161283.1 hypothetical protein SARC_00522 [Sphaeroforma arctica JP610]
MRQSYAKYESIECLNTRHKGNNYWGWQLAIIVGPGIGGMIKHFGVTLFYMETKAIYNFALDSLQKSIGPGPKAPLNTRLVFAEGFLTQADVNPGQFFFSDRYHIKINFYKNLRGLYSGKLQVMILDVLHPGTRRSSDAHFIVVIQILQTRDADSTASYIPNLVNTNMSRYLAN